MSHLCCFVVGLVMAGLLSSAQGTSDVHPINVLYGHDVTLDCNKLEGVWYHNRQSIGRRMSLKSVTFNDSGHYQCKQSPTHIVNEFDLHVFGVMGLTPLSCDEPSNDICKKNVIRGDDVTLCVNLTTFPASVDDEYQDNVLNISHSYWYKFVQSNHVPLSACDGTTCRSDSSRPYHFNNDSPWYSCMTVPNVAENMQFSYEVTIDWVVVSNQTLPSGVRDRLEFSLHVQSDTSISTTTSSSSMSSSVLSPSQTVKVSSHPSSSSPLTPSSHPSSSSPLTPSSHPLPHTPDPQPLAAVVAPALVSAFVALVISLGAIFAICAISQRSFSQKCLCSQSQSSDDDAVLEVGLSSKKPHFVSSGPSGPVIKAVPGDGEISEFDLTDDQDLEMPFDRYTQDTEAASGYTLSSTEEPWVPLPPSDDPPQEGNPRATRPGTLPLKDLRRNNDQMLLNSNSTTSDRLASSTLQSNMSNRPLILGEEDQSG